MASTRNALKMGCSKVTDGLIKFTGVSSDCEVQSRASMLIGMLQSVVRECDSADNTNPAVSPPPALKALASLGKEDHSSTITLVS